MNKIILVRFGEIFLKGLNRPFFIRILIERIKLAINDNNCNVFYEDSRIYVKNFNEDKIDFYIERIKNVFGVHSLSIAFETEEKSLDNIKSLALSIFKDKHGSFKVQSKRSDKLFALNSQQLSAEIGAHLLRNIKSINVDVHHPQNILYIEVRKHVYIYTDTIEAVGGMPIGTNGKASLLLSGGIDSPVAGWMVAKRGVTIDAIHFHSHPYTSELALNKVIDLAKALCVYTGDIKLHIVPFTDIQLEIYKKCKPELGTLIMRRYMMKICEKIANKNKSLGLITGESIGQVASQTMQALLTTDSAVSLPIYRPLIGFDKIDIIRISEKINTFKISSLPYEDCCTVFTPKHPKTRPNLQEILEEEQLLQEDSLINEAILNTNIMYLKAE